MQFLIFEAIAAVLAGYLIGSVSFANLAARHFPSQQIMDLRRHGAGASTVYHARGFRAAAVVFLGDFSKGMVVVLVTEWLTSPKVGMLAGAAAVAGHNWPLYYRFKGGRGVAAAVGSLVPVLPLAMGLGMAVAAVAFFLTRNMVITSSLLFLVAGTLAWLFAYPMVFVLYGITLGAVVAAYTYFSRRRVPLGERWRTTFIRHRWSSRES